MRIALRCVDRAPVKVGAVLRVTGRVAKHSGRKLHIHATLDATKDGEKFDSLLASLHNRVELLEQSLL